MTKKLDYMKIGDEYYKKADYKNAIKWFKKSLREDKDPFLCNLIGHLYSKINKYKNINKQIYYFKKAIEIKPDYVNAIRNLAFAYNRAEETEKSIEYFEKVIELGPITDDYVAYACRKIKNNEFEEGWKYYEYRFSKDFGKTYYPEMNKPRWEGEDISDKTLLVQHEQGLGDSIQFFRYLPGLTSIANKVIFRTQTSLRNLLKINAKGFDVVGEGTKIENIAFDCHIPLLSLMNVRKERKETIPLSEGYIEAEEISVQDYKKEFFDNDCIKIGITWHGAAYGNDLRNVPLETFFPLTKLKNIKLYSFQKGIGAKDLENLPKDIEIIDLGKTFNDFSDTAAAMANLDLFITSDNSVFNLAGAMGIKTYVLLNKNSEWRWFLDTKTTPWYDSVRIFKKRTENESWNYSMRRILKRIESGKL